MLVPGDTRQGRARLALAAGAEQEHLVTGQVAHVILGDRRRHVGQIAGFAGGVVDPVHGAAEEGDPPTMQGGHLHDGLDARHIGREAGDGDPSLERADHLGEVFAHLRLGPRLSLDQGVGGIADHRGHALLGQPPQGRFVVVVADQRIGIELPVAGVQHRACRSADHKRIGLRDRVGQGDQFDLEGPDLEAAGQGHLRDDLVAVDTDLGQLAVEHAGGKRRGVDRALEPGPDMGHRPDMVLVGMGQDKAGQLVAPLLDETRVRHDQIDPGQPLVGEGDAQVDHEPGPVVPIEVQVHSNLAGPAERQEPEILRSGQPAHGRSFRLAL
jgi:hypothetical protein